MKREDKEMLDIQLKALDDAKKLISDLERAGWTVMTISSVTGYMRDGKPVSMISLAVDREQVQNIQGA